MGSAPIREVVNWGALFERGTSREIDEADVRDVLARRRASVSNGDDTASGGENPAEQPSQSDSPRDPSQARIVADADVLAADLLVNASARAALDHVRRHSWMTLVASQPLLADAEWVIGELSDPDLADSWRGLVEKRCSIVTHPASDHPALASAYRGGAMHVLSFDDDLTSATAGATLRGRVPISIRDPRAFCTVFDAERLYPTVVGGEYPGPDRDPRG